MIPTYRTLYNKYQALYGDDTCIFLLVGKFYELYDTINPATDSPYTSILRATRIMNVQVSRKEDGSLFAGVPEQTRDKFAQTLTSRGWTVVIVDQVKNAANKVTDRVTARILSPGTHVEMAGQERMSVAAVYFCPGPGAGAGTRYATSVNDLTTGEVFSLETNEADSILHMYQIYNVTEIVAVTTKSADCVKGMFGLTGGQVHCVADSAESEFAREEFFGKMFKVRSLMPVKTFLGIPSQKVEKSLLFLLRFVEDHFPQQAERLTSHTLYNPAKTMRLSNNIIEQLSIITTNGQKSILDIVDHTFSSIGKRALRERILRPVTDPAILEQRWSQVAWAQKLDAAARKLIERDLKGIYDLPRLHFKIACGSITAVDILQLFQSYGATGCLIENLADTPLACPAELHDKIVAYRTLFTQMFDEGKANKKSQGEVIGFLTDEAGPLTATVEREIQDIVSSWKKSLAAFAAESGIPYTAFSVESYTLTAPRNLYASLNAKKFTAGSSGFLKGFSVSLKKSGPLEIQCDAFTAFCQKMMAAEYLLDKVLKEEYTPICDTLWDSLKLPEWITWLGDIDSTLSLAAVAKSLNWSKPSLGQLSIDGLRHPLLEAANTRTEYVTHSVSFDTKGWLIYGVNASGKSSLMKATGIAVILAQAGSFVPATAMSLRPYDAAFSRIWSHDNIWAGLSSFAVEVTELSEILRLATDRSLVLGDEVCSGTESSSATALVAATIEALQAKGTHFMFATHLHDLLKVPGLCEKVAIWHLRVITLPNGKLVYDRSLQPGNGSSCYGLEVAKAMGLPYEIIQRAHDIRRGLEGTVTVQDAPKSRYNSQIQRRACEVCGSKDVRQLEVHHIEEQAKGGSNQARNLAVLCEKCHDDHHNKKIEVAPLTQTSLGLERIVKPKPAEAPAPAAPGFGLERFAHVEKPDTDLIKQIVLKHTGRPAQRIASILQEEHGIKMSATQLKRYIK